MFLGSLISSSVPKIFTSLSKTLISTLSDSSTSPEVSRAYIMLVGTLSRSAPQKTGQVIKEVMPSILQICRNEEDEDGREVGLAVSFHLSLFELSGSRTRSSYFFLLIRTDVGEPDSQMPYRDHSFHHLDSRRRG